MPPRGVAVLGCDSLDGAAALDAVTRLDGAFRVSALAAVADAGELAHRIASHGPGTAAVLDPEAHGRLAGFLESAGPEVRLLEGVGGLCEMASSDKTDIVVLALKSSASFAPLLAALKAGKTVVVADKDPLVMAGEQFMLEADRWGARVLPATFGTFAVLQCLCPGTPRDRGRAARSAADLRGWGESARRVFLAAPGKKKADARWTAEKLLGGRPTRRGTREMIDKLTLMDAGLELAMVSNVFGIEPSRIEVGVGKEPQMIAAVELSDGGVAARYFGASGWLPSASALAWPERIPCEGIAGADFRSLGKAALDKPDLKRYPCLGLALEAVRKGGTLPAVLTAADDVAVERFLAGAIRLGGVAEVVEKVMAAHRPQGRLPSFAEVVEADQWARAKAGEAAGALGAAD